MNAINLVRDKTKKLRASGALHVVIGTFCTKFVAFFGSIVLVRLMEKPDYGLLSYVENVYSYAFIFAGLGLANGLLRYVVLAKEDQEKTRLFKYVTSRSAIFDLCIGVILCVLLQFIPLKSDYEPTRYLVFIIALLLPFQDLLNEGLYGLRALFQNKLYAYLAFGTSSLLIIGRIVGNAVGGVSGVLWSRVILNAAFSIAILLLCTKKFFNHKSELKLPGKEQKTILVYSIQYMITNGFWALFMLNDIALIGTLIEDSKVLADFKAAYMIPANVSIFATAIGVFVGPYFTKNEKNLEWVRRNFKKVFLLSMAIVGCVSLGIIALTKPIVLFIYGSKYLNIVPVMRVLLIAAFINNGLRFTTANLLAAMGMIRSNMIVSGIGMVLQVILDFIFIPKYGIMGVAVCSCVEYLVMAISLFVVFYRKYYMNKKQTEVA